MRPAVALRFSRRALFQVAVDAGLIALAYYLAFELRFDRDVPSPYSDLFEQTIGFAAVGSVSVFALFGCYRDGTRQEIPRVHVQIVEAAVVATLALSAFVTVVQPTLRFDGARFYSVNVPPSVLVLYGVLMLALIGASRGVVHVLYERRSGR